MNKIVLLFACIFYMQLRSTAQAKTILLKGSIQQYPVIMELSFPDQGNCSVRYFYENQRKDIKLNGVVDAKGTISVVTDGWDSGNNHAIREKFELRPKDGMYTGTWKNRKKVLPVQLKEVNWSTIKNPFEPLAFIQQLKKEEPYNYIRTSALEFIKDSTRQMNNCTLDWYHEKYSKIVLFRISKGYETTARKKMNDQLTETHVTESIHALECSSGSGGGTYEQAVQHFFATDGVLSINLMTSYYCGGAHPGIGSNSLNFDARSGQQLLLDEVLWFGKGKPPKEDTGEWYNYRSETFAPMIVSLLKQYYPEQMQYPKNTDEECDYTDPERWKFPNWYFTSKGLYVGAVFAHAAQACSEPEWAVIPYPALKHYVHPGSKIILPR